VTVSNRFGSDFDIAKSKRRNLTTDTMSLSSGRRLVGDAWMNGNIDHVTRGYIEGWAANPRNPNEEVLISVLVNGVPVAGTRATRPRDDLKNICPGATGRYAFRFDFPEPLSLFDEHEIAVVSWADGEPLPGSPRVIPAMGTNMKPAESMIRPILLTSTGRSGSSAMMEYFENHDEIIVAGRHPFEVKLIEYYSLALRTLVSEADNVRSTHADTMVDHARRFSIGFNPFHDPGYSIPNVSFHDYFDHTTPGVIKDAFKRLIEEYYKVVGSAKNCSNVHLFAEKIHPSPLFRKVAEIMFPAVYEIALIRDPRDIVCSYKSFWSSPLRESIAVLKEQLEYLVTFKNPKTDNRVFIRYEDMITDVESALAKVNRFLGIRDSSATACVRKYRLDHGTSPDAGASVQRWRRELNSEEAKICNVEFAAFLDAFGYESV
jgi:sulfotransferase family protein